MSLDNQLQIVNERIRQSLENSGRHLDSLTLLTVTKKRSVDEMRQAYSLGLRSFGENYMQEAVDKQEQLADLDIDWHFIGSLQSKKAKHVVGKFSLIHSLDRQSLAEAIDRAAAATKTVQRVLLQVNVAGEESKAGVSLTNLVEFYEQVQKLEFVKVVGLMTMPPLATVAENSRKYFAQLRESLHELKQYTADPDSLRELSMGTTGDYSIAIEEGATIVRLGTSLFGPRQ